MAHNPVTAAPANASDAFLKRLEQIAVQLINLQRVPFPVFLEPIGNDPVLSHAQFCLHHQNVHIEITLDLSGQAVKILNAIGCKPEEIRFFDTADSEASPSARLE